MIDTELYDRQPLEGRSGGKRELPVLFHLRDVSRPRVKPSIEAVAPPPTVVEAPPSVPPPVATSVAAPPEVPLAPPPLLYSLEPQTSAARVDVFQTPSELPPASLTFSPPAEATVTPAPPMEVAASSSEPAASEIAAELRPSRRFNAPATEQWFATHGRFIAAGFVLALIGTIYLARTTRRNAPRATQAAHSAPLLAATETSAAGDGAITIDFPGPASSSAASSSATASAKPTPPEAPKVELQMPVAAQAEASPARPGEKAVNGDSLFVFQANKRAEERVAARSDVTPASANLPSPPPVASAIPPSGTLPAAYPVTNSPALYQEPPSAQASYPRTSAPMLPPAMPVAAPPVPPSPAVTTYGGNPLPPAVQGAFVPQQNGPATTSWQPPVGAPPLPGPYQPLDTTARGPRYERTGSGNY